MRAVLTIILLLSFLIPAQAVEDQYIAVYSSPNLKQCWKNCKHKINKIWASDSWDDFDIFLGQIGKESNNRPIILDMCVHGNDRDGLLSKCHDDKDKSPNYFASVGMVLNHIEHELAGHRVTIIFETCYGSHCYRSTVRGNFPIHSTYYWIENHVQAPNYPIYGCGYSSNWATLAFEEYFHSLEGRTPVFLRDIRQSTAETTAPNRQELTIQYIYLDFLRKLDN